MSVPSISSNSNLETFSSYGELYPIGEMMKVIKTTQARQIKSVLQPIEIRDLVDFISKNLHENEQKRLKEIQKIQIKEMESEVEWNPTAISESLDLLEKKLIDRDGAILETERSFNRRYIKKGTTMTT